MAKQINASDVTRGNVFFIPPEELIIQEGANARRYETKDEAEMALNILDHGQLVPILCRRDDTGRPVVIDGHWRTRALRYINTENLYPEGKIKARCEVIDADEDKQAFILSIKTFLRRDQSPVDAAYSMRKLTEFGLTQREAAKVFGRSEAWASKVVRLADLPSKVQRQIHAGQISFEAGYELSLLTPSELDEALSSAEEGSRTATAATAQRTKRQAAERQTQEEEAGGKGDGKEERPKRQAPERVKPAVKMRTLKEIRLFFIDLDNAVGTARGPIEEFAGDFLKFMDGRLSDAQLENRLRKLAEG